MLKIGSSFDLPAVSSSIRVIASIHVYEAATLSMLARTCDNQRRCLSLPQHNSEIYSPLNRVIYPRRGCAYQDHYHIHHKAFVLCNDLTDVNVSQAQAIVAVLEYIWSFPLPLCFLAAPLINFFYTVFLTRISANIRLEIPEF
jgi:hypothetical protein